MDFQLDKTENLSNGDTVTVTAVYDDYLTETYGCIPESDTKTYTVEGLDSYMTSFDGLPDGALDEVHTDSRDRVESLIANKEQICGAFIDWSTDTPDTYQVDTQNLKLYTSYLLVSKGADFGAKYSNRYIAVYHTTGSMSKKSWFGDSYNGDMYIAVDYKDLKFDESGNLIVNLTDAEYTYFTTADNAYNYWMTSNKDCYKVFEQKAVAPAAAPGIFRRAGCFRAACPAEDTHPGPGGPGSFPAGRAVGERAISRQGTLALPQALCHNKAKTARI